tara:strand:+ start:820 stop:2007 length:1188 start_codon:yes stop_codon:yes gene_type:complete
MALPYSYSRDIDTLFSVASDTVSGDPVNLINAAGEKLLPELAAKGRIFMVNDAKQVSHPVVHADGGGAIVDYVVDANNGGTAAGHTLDNAAKEILSHAKFDMIASSRNISFAQDMPAGNQLDFMVELLKSNGVGIFQREESLLLTGGTDGGATVASNAPCSVDTNFKSGATTRAPMSILGLMAAGTTLGGDASDGDETDESFAGLKVDDVPHWEPQRLIHTGASGSTAAAINTTELEDTLQKLILQCTFSGVESPDTILCGTSAYEHLLKAARTRLSPTHLMENQGYGTESFMFAGCKVIRHRMLEFTDVKYDRAEGNTECYPIHLLNLKSLRMNIVKQDMNIGEGFGFLSSPIEGVFPHPTTTNLFKRVGWKRCYSLDNGRRSFGSIDLISDFD